MFKSRRQFLINLVFLLAITALLQSCATMFSGDPDDMDGAYTNDNTPSSQSAPIDSRTSPGADDFQTRVNQAIRSEDIVLGMTQQDVLASWGRPREIQTAGDPMYGNARWVYYSTNSLMYGIGKAKTIYFEGGKVVGWQSSQN